MTEPTDKSPPVNNFLSELMGKDRAATIKADKCMTCNGTARTFRDNLSRCEYAISGICQRCQDEAFAPPPPNA